MVVYPPLNELEKSSCNSMTTISPLIEGCYVAMIPQHS